MRNRETDMFSREKRQIVSSLRVTFIYYNQYITSSTGLSFSLSLLNLIIVPAVSIKLLTLIALRFLYYNQHISSTESLSLSLSSIKNLIIVRGIDQITLRFQLLDFQSHAPLNFLLPPRISLAFRQQLLVLRDAISG